MAKTRKDLGIPHFGECEICDISSPIHILTALDYYDDVRLMNGMAKSAQKAQENGQLDVFTAYLESHRTMPYESLIQGVNHLDRYTMHSCKTAFTKFYVPLSVKQDIPESSALQPYPGDFVQHEDAIREKLTQNAQERLGPDGLAQFLNQKDSAEEVLSILPDVEVQGGELWGTLTVELRGWLPETQWQQLKEFCIGQLSDGWGEMFEQQPIATEDGPLYVSFWNDSESWRLYAEKEFQQMLEQTQWPDNPGPAQG